MSDPHIVQAGLIALQHLGSSTLYLFLRHEFLVFLKLTAAHIFFLQAVVLAARTQIYLVFLIVRFHHILNTGSIAAIAMPTEPTLNPAGHTIPFRRVPTLLEKLGL